MSSSKSPLFAFKFVYAGIANTLVTPVLCLPRGIAPSPSFDPKPYEILALWDTGATDSCITPAAAKRIGIHKSQVRPIQITGVNSKKQWCPVYKTGALVLPQGVPLPGQKLVEATVASPHAEILIGMDIISQGDFAISNGGGNTTFCFSMPPAQNPIDLLEKAERVNKRRKQPLKIRN